MSLNSSTQSKPMKLTFGYALDGFRPPAGKVALGELTCGPLVKGSVLDIDR